MAAQQLISFRIVSLSKEKAELADERGKIISQLLSGMKIIKFNVWEELFLGKIDNIRRKESNTSVSIFNYAIIAKSLFVVASKLIYLGLFFILQWLEVEMTVPKLFSVMSILNSLEPNLSSFINALTSVITATTSSKRFGDILKMKEKEVFEDSKDLKRGSVLLDELTVTWDDHHFLKIFEEDAHPQQTHIMRGINIRVNPGEFIGVIGGIGSGKSTLLLSMMNELNVLFGRAQKNGSIAYIPQQSFMMNETIQNNILFGKPFEQYRYNETLGLCELTKDLLDLPSGDQTEIGEGGINLSGGQKQRISIARALYSDADIYIIDDALSALDHDVGTRIMKNLFLNKLKSKTRIMATHKISILKYFDRIVYVNNSKLELIGTLEELQSKEVLNEFIFNGKSNEDSNVSQKSLASEGLETAKKSNTPDKLTIEEKYIEGNIESTTYLRYIQEAGLISCILLIAISLINEIIKLFMDYWMGKNVQLLFNENGILQKEIFSFLIVFLLVVIIIKAIFFGRVLTNAAYSLCKKMLANLIRRPMSYFDTTSSGTIMNRCTQDVSTIDNHIPIAILDSLTTISLFLVTFTLSVIVAWISIVAFLVLVIIGVYWFNKYLRISLQLTRMVKITNSPVLAMLNEMNGGALLFRHYGIKEFIQQKFIEISDLETSVFFHEFMCGNWLKIRLDYIVLLMTMIPVSLVTTAVIIGYIDNESSSSIGVTINSLMVIGAATSGLIFTVSNIIKDMACVERVQEFIDYRELEDTSENINVPITWPTLGSIEIRNLSVRYRPETPFVLRDLNLKISSREKIGIIGRTGSGKSTLFLALMRIIESDQESSEILIDGLNIKDIGIHKLRKGVSIVSQDPLILEGSILTNLDPEGMLSIDKVLSCISDLKLAQHFNISLNPDLGESLISEVYGEDLELTSGGNSMMNEYQDRLLNYKIEQNGKNISQGQKQLISIAREILKQPKILLMDEATASIDEKTDRLLQRVIEEEFKNSTIIAIAHRIETLRLYDRIVIMDNGKVIDSCTPGELSARIRGDIKEYF